VIVDTSALIAILRDEAASRRRISAANFVEAAIVIDTAVIPLPAAALRVLCGRCS
jgi:uncharacterized protein with PIN domain